MITNAVIDAINETINVAIDQIRTQKFSAVKIALFSNFDGFNALDLDRFKLKIIPRLREHSMQLIIISDFTPNSLPTVSLSRSAKLALDLMQLIEKSLIGFFYDLKTSLITFGDFETKKTYPSNWYSNLQLGSGINALNISIAANNKVVVFTKKKADIAFLKKNQTLTKDNTSDLNSVKSLMTPFSKSVTIESESNESIKPTEKVIRGYPYGQTIVPIIEENKNIFNYDKLAKGIQIIGFTSIQNIDSSQRMSSKTIYVFPDPRLPPINNHKMIFQSLVSAMLQMNKVAIVRYGWSDQSAPQIGYLFPFIEDNNLLLTYIQLPFAEDIRKYRFPSLDKSNYSPTDKQLEAIDSLIDSMDLMDAEVDDDHNKCEAFKFGETTDPLLQHWFSCLYYRHMNQNQELPQISDYHRSKIETPLELSERAVKPLLQILETFSLDGTKKSTPKKKIVSKRSDNRLSIDSNIEIKRQKIDNQFNENFKISDMKSIITDLFELNTSFEEIAIKFREYFKILFENFHKFEDKVEEIVDLIEFFRQKSIESEDPKPFNDFLFDTIQWYRGKDTWYSLLNLQIKPIGHKECPKSQLIDESIENFVSLIMEDM